jgi:pheromone shutdown protein TraB
LLYIKDKRETKQQSSKLQKGRDAMKTRDNIAKKAGLAGAGIGLVLFAVVGVLYGSLIGGTMGLGIVNSVLGVAAGATLISRLIVAASMLAGVIVSGIMFVTVCTSIGWLAGYIIGAVMEPKATAVAAQKTR